VTISLNEIPALYTAFRTRWSGRDDRTIIMDSVVAGEWSNIGPDDEELVNRSPNLIQVGIEDTAEAASTIPTIRVTPSAGSDPAKSKAEKMELMAASYLDRSQYELLNIQSLMELVAFGYNCWTIHFDPEDGGPLIEWRDPRTFFPEPGWRPGDSIRRAMFARELYLAQLPVPYQEKVADVLRRSEATPKTNVSYLDHKVTLVEFFTEEEIVVAAMFSTAVRAANPASPSISWTPVILERTKTPAGICPVVSGQRITLDTEPRGQFDQVVDVMQAHIRLTSLVLDYSDQAVYSDIWVKDLIGNMPFGGGSYVQLGPQGAIGRVQPAVTNFAVEHILKDIVDNIHLGGRWPKSRPGEIDQAIASAKFVEATAGMMNTVIRTLHLIMKRSLEQALRICFAVDKELGKERTVAGVLRNQQFMIERKKSDIDLKAQVKVDYGIGLGRDPAQTMVLGIQGMQTGIFSTEFVQENLDGLTDVAKERRRIDVQHLRDMAFAQLMQGLQQGTIPETALVEIAKKRANGEDIFELFDEYVVKPKQAQQDAMIPSGLGGPGSMPGQAPAAAGGPQPPVPPDAGSLLGALAGGPGGAPAGPGGPPPGGPGGTPPPGPVAPASRLNIQLPGRGFVSTSTGG